MKYIILVLSILFTSDIYASASSSGLPSLTTESIIVTNEVSDSIKSENSIVNKPVVRSVSKTKSKKNHSSKSVGSSGELSKMTFDFNYSGDVSGLLAQLRAYDSTLTILHALGTKQAQTVNISLQAAMLDDINQAIISQSNNKVSILYNQDTNTIRLNYISFLDVGHDAISESLKWQQGGNPKPVLKQDGVVRFPYGEYQPVVTCQPLNLCDIELQAGEDVQGIVIGDSQRWNEGDEGIPVVYSGVASKLTPHLVLKPSQSGLDTTLMVTTSKRTYMLRLKSGSNGYVARVGFYYPAEMVQTFKDNKTKLKSGNNEAVKSVDGDNLQMPLVDLNHVKYNYTVGSGDYTWRPTVVFDDGVSVYIQLPDGVSSRSLPGLCILVNGDDSETKCEMANFRYSDHFYIVDKLFDEAKLINGYGDYMETITISRKPEKPGFWARLFD